MHKGRIYYSSVGSRSILKQKCIPESYFSGYEYDQSVLIQYFRVLLLKFLCISCKRYICPKLLRRKLTEFRTPATLQILSKRFFIKAIIDRSYETTRCRKGYHWHLPFILIISIIEERMIIYAHL